MTIKQQGGIFGRNPTFNDVDVEGTLTSNTFTATSVTTENISTVNTDATSYASSSGSSIEPSGGVSSEIRNNSNGGFSWLKLRTTNFAASIGYIGYYNQGGGVVTGNMAFGGRTGSSAYTEQMSLNMANGNLSLNSGNLVVSNGKGIDFSATSGTGTSELFDDYEEGSHTSSVSVDGGSATLDGSFNTLSYTKTGNVVHVSGALKIASVSSPTGNINFSLPFAASGLGTGTIQCDNFLGLTGKVPQVFINNAQSIFYVSLLDQATGENETAASVFDATTFFRVSITYKTS